MKNCDLVKSCERVRDLGEVFTPEHIVKNMCDLVPKSVWNNINSKFLEPACGTGNFMVEILSRKLKLCKSISDCKLAVQSVYGIDIMQDNVDECKCRMLNVILIYVKKKDCLCLLWNDIKDFINILDENVICGNSLSMLNSDGSDLKFKNWETGEYESLKDMVNKQQSLNLE